MVKRNILVIAAAAAAGVLAMATPAFANDYNPPFHQAADLPIVASDPDFLGNVDECDGAPTDQDLWHFVLPGSTSDFVQLNVTFNPGGPQVITDFGPPDDKHAFAFSAPGAQLTAASATVTHPDGTAHEEFFNLSHTCTGTSTTTTTTTTTTTSTTGTETTPGESSSEPGFPVTGTAVGGLVTAGLVLVLGGAGLIVALMARRRSDAAATDTTE